MHLDVRLFFLCIMFVQSHSSLLRGVDRKLLTRRLDTRLRRNLRRLDDDEFADDRERKDNDGRLFRFDDQKISDNFIKDVF